MTFTRRGFLGLLATGAVGACVATKIPTAWLPESVRRLAASEFLRNEFNACATSLEYCSTDLRAGSALFEAIESETVCLMRFTPAPAFSGEPSLCFKGARMVQDKTIPPWAVILIGPTYRKYARFTPTLRRAA